MQQAFTIKNKTIGEGRPIICVPVVETTAEAIIAKIEALSKKNVQMIEWRVDCFEGIETPERVTAILDAVGSFVKDIIFLFTIRTKKQGGNAQLPEKSITYLNELAAKSGCVDLVDLEFFEATKPEKSIGRLQRMGVRVIASHHEIQDTPESGNMRMVLEKMQQGGADVTKLAVMPNSTQDVLRVLQVTNEIKSKYPSLPVVTMSMGALGVVSRIVGEAFGSCVTFGADGAVSAPGQMQMDALAGVLDALHTGITGEKSA